MAQPPILPVFFEMGRFDQATRPGIKLVPVVRRPRAQLVEFAGRQDERISCLLLRRELRVDQSLTNAEGGNDNLLRIGLADDLLQHRGAVG